MNMIYVRFITVNLKFVGKSYTITKEELMLNRNLSAGDRHVRALEIAVRKYLEEEGNTFHKIQHIGTDVLGGG